jgi:signal transduction histidine kinase
VSVQLRGSTAKLIVEDNGSGIAAENIDHIFEPFFTSRPDGTGLGLAVVKEIVADHSGDVSAVSELGKGTKFVVQFPVPGGSAL